MQENVNIPDSNITANLTFRQLVLMNMQQLTNFPYIEKDFDALTDYELLCLVVKFLNDVIANQNEQNDSITNMYNAFLALQTYVNNTKDTLEDAFNNLDNYVRNYFDNLDVQEEINNKLDDMVEQGTLQEIIYQFLQTNAVWCFDTVADMKLATNFVNGSYARTLGFHSINDGGSSLYKIKTLTNEVIDEMKYIALADNTLVAEFIYETTLNPHQFGAYGDGTHDDTLALNTAIASGYDVDLGSNGSGNTYLVTSPLLITSDNTHINGHKNTVIHADQSTFNGLHVINITGQYVALNQVSINISNQDQTINGFYIDGFNCYLNNCSVTGTGNNCLYVNKAEARVLFCKFRGFKIGAYIHGYDFYGEDIYCEQCTSTGFYNNGYGSMELHHIHSYGNGNHGFYLNGTNYSNLYGCYADTNAHNGFEIRETFHSNFFGCWAFKSNQSEYGYGFYISNTSGNNNFYGCFSTQPGTKSQGSYLNGTITNVLSECYADSNPTFDEIPICRNCTGKLIKYNTGENEKTFTTGSIAVSSSQEVSLKFSTNPDISSPGVRGYEIHYIIRNNGNTWSKSGIINFTNGGTGIQINYNGDTNPGITISNISVNVDTDNIVNLTFTVSHSQDTSARVGGFVKYIGTDRGN